MVIRMCLLAGASALLVVGIAAAQYPILDMAATQVIQKSESATCEQLWEARGKPKPQR